MKKVIENKIVYLIEIALIVIWLLCAVVVIQDNKEDARLRGNQILSRRQSHHTLVRSKKPEPSKSISRFVTILSGESHLKSNVKPNQE